MFLTEAFGRSTTPGAVSREHTMAGFEGLHPKDYVELRRQGKTAADISAADRALSRAKNFVRTSRRDAAGLLRAHRLRTGKDRPGEGIPRTNRVQKMADHLRNAGVMHDVNSPTLGKKPLSSATAIGDRSAQIAGGIASSMNRWKGNQAAISKRAALAVGGTIVGTGIALQGIKTFRNWRKKAKEKTQYRGYDVYPEHEYAAVGQQPYNQAYYNESINEEIIDHIRAFKHSTKYLF